MFIPITLDPVLGGKVAQKYFKELLKMNKYHRRKHRTPDFQNITVTKRVKCFVQKTKSLQLILEEEEV